MTPNRAQYTRGLQIKFLQGRVKIICRSKYYLHKSSQLYPNNKNSYTISC